SVFDIVSVCIVSSAMVSVCIVSVCIVSRAIVSVETLIVSVFMVSVCIVSVAIARIVSRAAAIVSSEMSLAGTYAAKTNVGMSRAKTASVAMADLSFICVSPVKQRLSFCDRNRAECA